MVADLGQLREECQDEEHQGIAMEMHDDEIFAPPSEIDVISREELKKIHRQTFSAQEKYQAQQIRKGVHKNQLLNIASIRPPAEAPVLPEDQIERGKMLGRQRTKADKRRKDNQRKAKNKFGYEAATHQTLALKKGIDKVLEDEKEYDNDEFQYFADRRNGRYSTFKKDIANRGWRNIDIDGIFPNDLFTPSFDMKTSATINVRLIRDKQRQAEFVVAEMQKDRSSWTPDDTAKYERLDHLRDLAQRHLDNILKANGIDLNGNVVPQADANVAKSELGVTATEYHELTCDDVLAKRSLDRLTKTDEYAETMRSTQVSDFTTNEDYRSIAASLAEFNRYPVGVLYKVPNDINNEYRRVAKFVQDRTQQINAINAMPSISEEEKQRFDEFLVDAQFNAARLRMEMLFDALQYIMFRKGEKNLAPGVHIMLQDDFGYITPQRAVEIREEQARENAGNA